MGHRQRWLLLIVTAAGMSACAAPPASEGGFDSDNPASILHAIGRAGAERDRTSIPKLVEQLESDDPAVRMLAIDALQRITGERLDYNPYDDAPRRQPAVDRWQQAVRDGRFAKD